MEKNIGVQGVSISGNPANPALVLLHSSLSSSAQWGKLCKALSDDFYLINFDLLGYGRAPQVSEPLSYSLTSETARISDCLQQLGIANFSLVGHSFGGAVALKLAYQLAERVEGIALFEPVAFHLLSSDSQERAEIDKVAGDIEHLSDAEGAAAFVNYWNGPGYFSVLPPEAQRMMAMQIAKVKLDFKGVISEPLRVEDYVDIRCRGLLMTGAMSPDSSIQVASVLRDAQPEWIVRQVSGGHMAPISHSAEVNQHIVDFLRDR